MVYSHPEEAFSVRRFVVGSLDLTFVLVEGDTDEALWTKFKACDYHCELQSYDGRSNVRDAIESVNRAGCEGVVAIVDADYWLVNPADELPIKNLLYDSCYPDAETIVLSSHTLRDVIRNYLYSYDAVRVHNLADKVLDVAKGLAIEIGYFRLLNDIEYYQIGFKNFWKRNRHMDFVDETTLEFLGKEFATELKEYSRQVLHEDLLLTKVQELKKNHEPNIRLCRGHDVIAIIASILPAHFECTFEEELPRIAGEAFQQKALEINLRSSYDSAYFRDTDLFDRIQKWEYENSPYKILKPEI